MAAMAPVFESAYADWRALEADFADNIPPPRFMRVQILYRQGMSVYGGGVRLIAEGAASGDSMTIRAERRRGIASMADSDCYYAQAQAELNALVPPPAP